jgi:hypothetical protein
VAAERLGIDLGTGQEGQQCRTEASQEVDPGRRVQPQKIAANDAHPDLQQGDRHCQADRDQAGYQREPDPQAGNQVDVIHGIL